MQIKKLLLQNFRSFKELALDLSNENIYILLGQNGIGKTNILESISILSEMQSFLRTQEDDLVHWGQEYTRIRADLISDQKEESKIEVVRQLMPRKQKACFINDVKIPLANSIGHLPTVAFLPQDLEIFLGPPNLRRRFLDSLLSQVSFEYSNALSSYGKILKQRNALLKKIMEGFAKRDDLKNWDRMIAKEGSVITLKRLELIEVFQCTLLKEIQTLGEKWESVELVYNRKSETRTQDELENEIIDLLEHYKERDLILCSTTIGPHRDDWHIEANSRSLTSFASRGQQRAAVLALIFLKVSFIEVCRGEKPVVLLDDVFSELDDNHQIALLKCFDDYQVIITATHIPKGIETAEILDVKNFTKKTSINS